jgi:hypothetical protein
MAVRLSTPIAYLSNSYIADPFGDVEDALGQGFYIVLNSEKVDCASEGLFELVDGTSTPIGTFNYNDAPGFSHGEYLHEARYSVSSRGPDRVNELSRLMTTYSLPDLPDGWAALLVEFAEGGDGIYDPTNGTLSIGELIRNANGLNGGR